MKNLKYYLIATTLTFMIVSCESELELAPETNFNNEQVFATEAGVESAINGMWVNYVSGGFHGSAYHALLNPLSGKFYSNQGASEDATSLNCLPINTWLERLWPDMYSTINNANIIISNLENTSVELSNKETSLGQAYFIRAYTYFDLVQLFGDVPLRTEPTTSADLHKQRAAKSEVYNLIISDLEKAKQLLPDFGEYRPERPVKYAANVVLAKVYMRLAGEDNGDPTKWQDAYNELIEVYGKYSLVSDYYTLFQFDPFVENTSESILELQYGHGAAGRSSDIIRTYTPSNYYFFPSAIRTFGRVRPNKETFDEHVNTYPTDPRIDATFIYNSYLRNNGNEQPTYPARTNGNNGFTYLKKYLDPTYNGTTTERNMIKLRYADVLLMLAEIENELNGPDNAYQYVNEVLERARNSSNPPSAEPANWSGMDQEQFRERIMIERRFELLGEGHEWFDTRRRGYEHFLQEVVEKHNSHPTFDPGTDYVYPVSIKNMLLPIPSSEISGNEGISQADQNPGY